jgi:hypothetical protein
MVGFGMSLNEPVVRGGHAAMDVLDQAVSGLLGVWQSALV